MTAKNHWHVYGQDKSKMASASIRIAKMLFDTNTTNPMYAEKDFATERRVAKVLCPWLVAFMLSRDCPVSKIGLRKFEAVFADARRRPNRVKACQQSAVSTIAHVN